MASYFVAPHAARAAAAAVHDRSRCPPACFLGNAPAEYLGEFLEPAQAVAVARLRYPHARGCPACDPARPRQRVLPALVLPATSA